MDGVTASPLTLAFVGGTIELRGLAPMRRSSRLPVGRATACFRAPPPLC
jgi:hypothetical protein